MSGDASKSNAIKKLINLYQITSQEIMAVGDNFNDMDMLEYAGLGVAMGNAPRLRITSKESKTLAQQGFYLQLCC
ncbi:HAD family hydrolase [Paenibacillus massiliensis]|uniref:HAD family hydrolase n=1 Tax=Paenibacillus massiliensis TaxID=225917 RepID=UPI00036F45EC|nr:HAD hydrolase family protein [Paenibacillus massiliensis]